MQLIGRSALVSFVMVSIGTGCSKSSAPSCEAAVQKLAKFGTNNDKATIDALTAMCVKEKWSAEFRACIGKATSEEEMGRCDERSGQRGSMGAAAARSEAELNLEAIARGAASYFVEHGQYPTGSAGITPPQPCCYEPDHACEPVASVWEGDIWPKLGFSIEQPHHFQYTFGSDGPSSFTATALGDLDCDQKYIEYSMEGSFKDGQQTIEMTRPAHTDD